ncbi:translational GTPase TypA [bacterium]|jgi:GTP-binding protein|nr:translational GTPase TypA [bacterium]MBT3581804.1 translational GTPase TypA [bacterium]MBT4552494.1 translational GTPase TypA [bacterium]MBT7087962.1 translational GTPase TypA [bacterium]
MSYQKKLRNIAIIAHVDHGKTTLVDQLFKQSGLFRDNQTVETRLMDSMDLEKERGITIMSKNCSCKYQDYLINIIDTPGHADFGGEVERVLNMADGVLFLVDAVDGPMPQSYFVLKKAVARSLPVIVIVNKIDRPHARCDWVVDQVFDLLVHLNAPDHILDFPIIYASAKNGHASTDYHQESNNLDIVFKQIIKYMPAPKGDVHNPLQLLISSLTYSPFLGRLAIGKITSGKLKLNQNIVLATEKEVLSTARITKLYKYEGNKQVETKQAFCGDIIAVAGLEKVEVGQTITDPDQPLPLPSIQVDPPTISITFLPNDSPFAGTEGRFVTSRQLKERICREILSDVALEIETFPGDKGFKVSGRGELHLSIFIEKMRREGYEFQVSRPMVILKEENGKTLEPYEDLTIDVPEEHMGKIIESFGPRKGIMISMHQENGSVRLKFKVPTRGLLGYQAQFMTKTKGMGVMNYVFLEYAPYAGDIKMRKNGVLISKDACTTIAYALDNLQDRGKLFLGAGEKVYAGQIIGEHCREDDLVVNPGKGKKLTNMRASGSDDSVVLTPYTKMSLEECLAYINDNEVVEITPAAIRLRKLKYRTD